MGIYARDKYYWAKGEKGADGTVAFKPFSTKIPVFAPTKQLRDQNRAAAEAIYVQALHDKHTGKSKLPAITFTNYMKEFKLTVAHLRGNQEYTLNRLEREFGSMLLTDFSENFVRVWRGDLFKTGKVRASTINLYVNMLSKMLTRAVPTYLESNPLAARRHGSNRKTLEILPEKEFKAEAFTTEGFYDFVRTIEKHDVIYTIPKVEGIALAYAAVETLVRRGSLLRLRRRDDQGTKLVVADTKTSGGKQKAPKAKPISAHLRECLDALYASRPEMGPDDLVFASFWNTEDRTYKLGWSDVAMRWFNSVCDLGGITHGRKHHGVTFHSFRHTGATWYLKAGWSVKAVMQLGGWTNAQLFLDTYVHCSEEEIADMVNKMSQTLHPSMLRLAFSKKG
jgi:integrase